MKVSYYRTAEDTLNHVVSTEHILWLDGFVSEVGSEVTFKRAFGGEEITIPFSAFISVAAETDVC